MALITNKNYTLNFGQFRGSTIQELIDEGHSDYLLWCHNNIQWFELSVELLEAVEGESENEIFDRRIQHALNKPKPEPIALSDDDYDILRQGSK